MRHLLVLAALVLVACPTTPPPKPKEDPTAPVLAALKEPRTGRWRMELVGGGTSEFLDVEDTWTPVASEDGRARFELVTVTRYPDGTRLASRLAYVLDEKGLWQVGAQVGPNDPFVTFDPPYLVIPAGAELGTRWFATPPTSGQTARMCELRTSVRCDVGLVVDCTSPAREGTLRRRTHYCADVPYVAIETQLKDARDAVVSEARPVDAPAPAKP